MRAYQQRYANWKSNKRISRVKLFAIGFLKYKFHLHIIAASFDIEYPMFVLQFSRFHRWNRKYLLVSHNARLKCIDFAYPITVFTLKSVLFIL